MNKVKNGKFPKRHRHFRYGIFFNALPDVHSSNGFRSIDLPEDYKTRAEAQAALDEFLKNIGQPPEDVGRFIKRFLTR